MILKHSCFRLFKYIKGVQVSTGGSAAALVEQYLEQDSGAKRAANLPVSQRYFYTSRDKTERTALSPRHHSIQLRLGDARLLASPERGHTYLNNLNDAHPLYFSETSPREAGLCSPLVSALYQLRIHELTPLQGALIPLILRGKHIIAHAETGTGKSFGIALAVANRLLRNQINYRLHTIILVPTEELSFQYEKWLRHFGGGSPQIVQVAVESIPLEVQLGRLHNIQPHILVGTPQRIAAINQYASSFLKEKLRRCVDCLILDEADLVLAQPIRLSRAKGTDPPSDGVGLVDRLFRTRQEEVPAQMVAASATVDSATARVLNAWTRNDAAVRLTSSFAEHSVPTSIRFYYFSANQRIPLPQCLSLVLRLLVKESQVEEPASHLRILLLTTDEEVNNTAEFVHEHVETALQELLCEKTKAHPLEIVAPLHSIERKGSPESSLLRKSAHLSSKGVTAPRQGRSSLFSRYPTIVKHSGDVLVKNNSSLTKFSEGKLLIGVSSFTSCRGLHVNNVTHVILYGDCPSATTFLHCAGRTGRMGNEGKVIVLFPPSSGRQLHQVCESVELPFAPNKIEEVEQSLKAVRS